MTVPQKEMLIACEGIADKYGLSIANGGMQEMNLRHGFDLVVRVGLPLPDGSIHDVDREKFRIFASAYGLEPDDFGRIFFDGREQFRIIGIEIRRPRYPINAERVADRRRYKFAAEVVAMCLNASQREN